MNMDPHDALDILQNAARGGEERFLIGISDKDERARIAAALSEDGLVVEAASPREALARLADEPFDLAVLCAEGAEGGDAEEEGPRHPLAAWRELRPFTDLVLISDGDPERWAEAFAREVAAVLPRPLPEVDALLRAHIKRLASSAASAPAGC